MLAFEITHGYARAAAFLSLAVMPLLALFTRIALL